MRLLGKELFIGAKPVSKELQDLQIKVQEQNEQLKVATLMINNLRPAADYMNVLSTGGVQMQRYPYSMQELYELVFIHDTTFTIINARTKAVFRNGYQTKEVFKRKCPECLTEYQNDNEVCDFCEVETNKPDEAQRKAINILYDAFMSKVNTNDQNIQQVQEPGDFDMNVIDDMFILSLFDYTYNVQGEIISKVPKEIIKANPIVFKMIADRTGRMGYDDKGQPVMFCPEHRSRQQKNEKCDMCKKKLVMAGYIALRSTIDGEPIYYMKDEVVHRSKFHPSMTYGISPMYKVWRKVHTLIAMDRYMQMYYEGMKSPKSALIFDTNDIQGLQAQVNTARDNTNRSPYEPLYLGVTRQTGSGPPAVKIDLANNLEEMQYIEARHELRQTIGAVWQVMPIFQGDLSTSGGLNNEGLQLTVSNQAIESDQTLHNGVLRELVLKFGITDYTIVLKPNEEKDEMAEIQREIAKADHAMRMQQLGFNVKLKSDKTFDFQGNDDGTSHKDVEDFYNGMGGQIEEPDKQTQGDKKFAASYSGAPVSKSMPALLTQARNLEDELYKELKKIFSKVSPKRKMSQEQMNTVIMVAANKIGLRLENTMSSEIKKIYQNAMNSVEKELNINVMFTKNDQNAVNSIKMDQTFKDAFTNLNTDIKKKFVDILVTAYSKPHEFTLDKIVKEMRKVVDDSEGSLMRIARTETNHISNIARDNSYKQSRSYDNMVFKWIGPEDDRTTDVCRELRILTEKGVPIDKLKMMIKETAAKYGFNARDFTPHFQCRHTFIRDMNREKTVKVKKLSTGEFEVVI